MRYRIFGRRTGLRVSELALGAGNFGTRWGHGAERAEAKKVFDAYVEAGGNFIDTADSYQFGESEELVGDFIAADRDYFVLATKYTLGTTATDGISRTGNSRKNMVRSVEGSLKRLKTDRIDLYWAHFADGVTPMEEICARVRRSGARRQDSLCRLVQLSRLANFSRRSLGGIARLGADRRHPDRIQPGAAHGGSRAFADGRSARVGSGAVVAARRRISHRQISSEQRGTDQLEACACWCTPRRPRARRRSWMRCWRSRRKSARRRRRSPSPGCCTRRAQVHDQPDPDPRFAHARATRRHARRAEREALAADQIARLDDGQRDSARHAARTDQRFRGRHRRRQARSCWKYRSSRPRRRGSD